MFTDDDEVDNVDVESGTMMKCGVDDVKPPLSSRNTLGNGNRKLKFSSGKLVVVAEVGGGLGKSVVESRKYTMGCGRNGGK